MMIKIRAESVQKITTYHLAVSEKRVIAVRMKKARKCIFNPT